MKNNYQTHCLHLVQIIVSSSSDQAKELKHVVARTDSAGTANPSLHVYVRIVSMENVVEVVNRSRPPLSMVVLGKRHAILNKTQFILKNIAHNSFNLYHLPV